MGNSIRQLSRLSYGQRALWYLNQLEPASTAYHLGICLELRGRLQPQALVAAWADIGARHPQLRAGFILREGEPFAESRPDFAPLEIQSAENKTLSATWHELAERPFALENEPPVRAVLLHGADEVSHLLLCAHHIVADLWSSAIILRELGTNYQIHCAANERALVLRQDLGYTEFVSAENNWLEGAEGHVAWGFWQNHLNGAARNPILVHQTEDGQSGEVPIVLRNGETDLVRQMAQRQATTPHAVLLACYARLLGEETGREELIIGTPASLRTHAALRNTVGYLVNAVPLRCPVGGAGADAITLVAKNAREALQHRRFPFSVLVERLGVLRTSAATPVFQTMFAYQALPRGHRAILPLALGTELATWDFASGINGRVVPMPAFHAQFPIALTLGFDGLGFSGQLQFDGRRVGPKRAAMVAKRFPELVRELLSARRLKSPPVTLKTSLERLEHLFDHRARRTPEASALCEGGKVWTYAEVLAKADALAAGLNALLPQDNRPVALQMPSCAAAVISILAILKSGRAFQPVDLEEPAVRRNNALLRTGAVALLVRSGAAFGNLPDGVRVLNLEQLERTSVAPTLGRMPSQAAYLIFTSGSTGEPKAVEVGHAAIMNHARAAAQLFKLTTADRVLQFHTLAFDAAFEEIFPAWVAGSCIVFEPEARTFSVPAFLESVERNAVTVLNLPTSYWHLLTAECVRLHLRFSSQVRLLIVGGEPAAAKNYALWRKLVPDCRWINTYGPTEATITALAYEPLSRAACRSVVPIGQPITGVTALVVNAAGKALPVGVGELLLGGKGLASGYCGDPEGTAARFVTRINNGQAQKFYRTGDRVRLRRDGNFEYLGRLDRQLKIRGYRVDPGEVEQAVRSHPAVMEAAVLPQKIGSEFELVAWVVPTDAALTRKKLRVHLLQHLPPHLIPARLNFVSRLPRKPSGKLEVAALANADVLPAASKQHTEAGVGALFAELLGRKIGARDDFFLSGGHSLLAIRLLGRIEMSFGVRVSVADFVANPTAQSLWRRIKSASPEPAIRSQEILPVELPVSAQQRRALLAHEAGLPAVANIVLLLQVKGPLNQTQLERAVQSAGRKNFLLRAGFFKTDAGIVLRDTQCVQLRRRTFSGPDWKAKLTAFVQREGSKPFAFDDRMPWLRLWLISAPGRQDRHLVLVTHHAVTDGWGLDLLLHDLCGGEDSFGDTLSAARDYRAYILSQASWLKSAAARVQTSFWQKQLADMEELRIPFRLPPSQNPSWEIERDEMILSSECSRGLRQRAVAYGVTPFALLMAAFKALVHRHTGQNDITFGTVVSNRFTSEDQGRFGPMQNPVLIRNEVRARHSFRNLARAVSRALLDAQNNGALPFAEVVREALPQHLRRRESGLQFLSQDHNTGTLRFGDATLHPVELSQRESPFELTVSMTTSTACIRIVFEHQTAAYSPQDIACLKRQYAVLLQSVVAAPRVAIGQMNLLSAAEYRALRRRLAKPHKPRTELLHAGYWNQARRKPQTSAIVAVTGSLTYGEVEARAKLTAQVLREQGLKPGGLVAVLLPKGWEQVVACLAILNAGGVYVPLESKLPTIRLIAILTQGGFSVVIAADETSCQNQEFNFCSIITIHTKPEGKAALRLIRVKTKSLAYVIFTSGSTGVPKGVMISHQAVMTTIAEINRRFCVGSKDRVFAVSALGFDLSVFDIFGTLRAGATIIIPDSSDPQKWLDQLLVERVTIWNSVPCLFELLLDEASARGINLRCLRLILLSGDFISLALARRIRTMLPWARLVCLGGATEGAIWSIAREVVEIDQAWHRVPYGRPLCQQEMFVLNEALEHCPPGLAGELFIAGAGLAEGYWHNRAETNRRFLRHPDWKIRLYRTGDQGRYLANGEIEILGRLDSQVKFNGVRLELGEVEAAIGTHPDVRQAVVEIRGNATEQKQLIAFVVAVPGTQSATILAHVRKALPATLVPARLIMLERLPLTASGKVDRAALHQLPVPELENPTAVPENPAEQWIAALWHDLLGDVTVGVEDDFFALGGHSLLAIKMLQRVRAHFAADLPLALIVERPTVRAIAAAIKTASQAQQPQLSRRNTSDFERDSEPVIASPGARKGQQAGAIVLTGVTGHLGASLLAELLQRTNDPVYCLIRAGSEEAAVARLQQVLQARRIENIAPGRIVAVPADLSCERFGLTTDRFFKLASQTRAIYHCAAEVNFIAPYEKLRGPNVGGVREVIRLATSADAVLHHVSSVAVFPYDGVGLRHETEDIAQIQTLTGGYAQSKWAAERMVWKAVARGLRAVIYRPAQILGRAPGAPRDLFDHVLRACQILRTVPDIETQIDLVPVDYAAAAIVALSDQATSLGRAFHLVHPRPVSLRAFVGLFPRPLPVVPWETWMASLRQEAQRSDDASLYFIALLAQGIGRAELTPPVFDCRATTVALRDSGVSCPPLDKNFVQQMLATTKAAP